MNSKYDSTPDTQAHISRVQQLLWYVIHDLENRAFLHDSSKLSEPEKSIFDAYTPLLKNTVYGSPEYKEYLSKMKVALDHHYAHNSHHPEHYPNGVNGMNLFDIIEMFVDWKAAGERDKNGDILISIEKNTDRFQISEQLADIFVNTVHYCRDKNIF